LNKTTGESSRLSQLQDLLSQKIIYIFSFIIISSVIAAFVYLSNASQIIIKEASIANAQRYLEAISEFRTLYTSEVVQTAKKHGLTVTHDYKNISNAIPLPATFSMELGNRIGQHQSGAKTYLYSPFPFPWRQQENQTLFNNEFAHNAWQELRKNPDKPYYSFENFEGQPAIRFAIADKMREACISCHNNHPDTPKNDWQVGDVRGVLEVILPITGSLLKSQDQLKGTFTVLALIALLFFIMLRALFKRLQQDSSRMQAKNVELTAQKDEIEQQKYNIEVANFQLEQHSAELEQANLTKSEFLACMSHEIRTPMNGVLGMLDLLSMTPLNKDQLHKTRLAQTSATSLLAIINDILDYSKIEAGKLELELIDFNIIVLLSEFTQLMALKAEEKGIELILDMSKVQQLIVNGDPGRLRQILTNLVSNAIKFTSKGEIVIRISLQPCHNNEMILTASISDTGIGIPKEKQSTLFDMFTQVDASTTRHYGGTGLGLSICKNLCLQMQGNLSVHSEVGQGSCFEFVVILTAGQQSKQLVPRVKLDKLKVLIIDDNATNREVLRGQLEYWGVNIVEADSGVQALIHLNDQQINKEVKPFDLAIIDMQMPGMDGAQLAEFICQDKNNKDLKLIMMTSMANPGDAQYFAKKGFSAYFSKPVISSDLFDALAVIIEGGEALEQAQPLLTHHYLQSLDHENIEQQALPNTPKLLLVEDNLINQEVALCILETIGLTADVANNGQEALDILKQTAPENSYDLILMDCQMPEMDGYLATQNIRKGHVGKHYQQIPIVAMTANAMKGDSEKCLAAGMDHYLTKPIEADEFQKLVKQCLTAPDL